MLVNASHGQVVGEAALVAHLKRGEGEGGEGLVAPPLIVWKCVCSMGACCMRAASASTRCPLLPCRTLTSCSRVWAGCVLSIGPL